MANSKKQILINEISFWKKNKMLPEHYCDYLLTLYTEGESGQIIGDPKQAVKAKERKKDTWLYVAIPLLAVVLFAMLFLAETFVLAVLPIALIGMVIVCSAFMFAKKSGLLTPILYVSGALIIFGVSVKLCITYYPNENTPIYTVLILNSLFWFLSGLKMKLTYLTVSGVLGLLAVIVYVAMN